MRVHWIAACLLLSACAGRACAEDPVEDRVDDEESLSEAYLEDSGETLLDLNTASLADLTALPHLTRRDAEKILAFRRAHGPYRSPAELTRIDGLPRPVVEAILPRVRANFAPAPEGGSRLRLMRRTGVDPSFLAGAGLRSRTTVRIPGLLDAAFTTDKDPEERRLADFAGGYVEVRPTARVRTVVGDFRPGFARGLVLSRWSRTPVGLEQVRRNPGHRVGLRSAEENGALRGGYVEGIGGPFRAAAFVSSARYDAARDTAGLVDRLMDDGLHVTATERSRKDALRERTVGLRLEGAGKSGWQAGLTAVRSVFTPPFRTREDALSGASAQVIGMDGAFARGGLSLGGEVAGVGGTRAATAGVALARRSLEAGIVFRDFAPGFRSLHGGGFSAFGESRNERGIFAGMRWKGRRLREATLTLDTARRPDTTATLPAGSARTSVTFSIRHAPVGGTAVRWSGRARWDQTWKGKSLGLVRRRRQSLRLDAEKNLGAGLRVSARGETVRASLGTGGETGGSAFGGMEARWGNVKAAWRVTYFDLPSYESRLFEWEDAPEGTMALRTLTGRGWKGYGTVTVKIGPFNEVLRVWRQHPLDGRRPVTEVLFQVEVKK